MKKMNSKQITMCGLAMAVVFLFTSFIAIPIGQFGYVNAGDCGIMIFAGMFNPIVSFMVAGIGSAMADLYLGYSQYAIFTLLIKGFEGVIVSVFLNKLKDKMSFISFIVGMLWMVFGYLLADTILYGDVFVALGGIGFNLIQGGISSLLACILFPLIKQLK